MHRGFGNVRHCSASSDNGQRPFIIVCERAPGSAMESGDKISGKISALLKRNLRDLRVPLWEIPIGGQQAGIADGIDVPRSDDFIILIRYQAVTPSIAFPRDALEYPGSHACGAEKDFCLDGISIRQDHPIVYLILHLGV